VCQRKLLQCSRVEKQQARTYPPSLLEWRANRKRVNMALPVHFSDGKLKATYQVKHELRPYSYRSQSWLNLSQTPPLKILYILLRFPPDKRLINTSVACSCAVSDHLLYCRRAVYDARGLVDHQRGAGLARDPGPRHRGLLWVDGESERQRGGRPGWRPQDLGARRHRVQRPRLCL